MNVSQIISYNRANVIAIGGGWVNPFLFEYSLTPGKFLTLILRYNMQFMIIIPNMIVNRNITRILFFTFTGTKYYDISFNINPKIKLIVNS